MKTLLSICFVAVFMIGGTARASALETTGGSDQYYLNAGATIQGESTAEGHKDEIDVYSYGFGATNIAPNASGGGGGAGKVKFNEFTITKLTDKATPALFLACAQGKHIPKVVLSAVRNGQPYLTVTLSNVLISSLSSGTPDSSGQPLESLTLNFTKIEISYRAMNSNGTLKPPVTSGWDLATNKGL